MSENNSISESEIVDAVAKRLAGRLLGQQQAKTIEPEFPSSLLKAGGAESPMETAAARRNCIAFPPSGCKAGGGE